MGGAGALGAIRAKTPKTKKTEKARIAQQHSGFCAGGSSRPNGSGYPLSVPAVAHPPPNFKVLGGGKGEVKPPPKCPTRHPGLAEKT